MAISRRRWPAWLVAATLLGCATGSREPGALRFYNRDAIWRVDDRMPNPRPTERVTRTWHAYVNTRVGTPVVRSLEFKPPVAALDVNALGGVPDSTWFQNRIGVRALSPREVAHGAGGTIPDTSAPWLVLRRTGPSTLLAQDARGRSYDLRLDAPDLPELETGADVVVSRLLWAAGYNVPGNALVCLRRDQLTIEPRHQKAIDAVLSRTPLAPGGCYRAVATEPFLGRAIDAFGSSGVRGDDNNDKVPHEQRRSLRGAAVFYAWTGDTEMQEKNTLDVWVEAPPGSRRGYLVHYLRDFGQAFGARGLEEQHEHDGFSTHFDLGYAAGSLFSLGFWDRPFESVTAPGLIGVGRYESKHFDPAGWSPQEAYPAFSARDRFDTYWAAAILARFSPAHVIAAVDQGQYSDPATRAYLIRTLLERQRKLLRQAFARVAPLDDFVLTPSPAGFRLCAVDLALAQGIAQPARDTLYTVRAYDEFGAAFDAWRELPGDDSGALCIDAVQPSTAADGYAMLVLHVVREGRSLPAVIVHVALAPRTRTLRIIGIERR